MADDTAPVRITSMWGEHGDRPEPLPANTAAFGAWTLSAQIDIAGTADDAWALITDISRIGELSPECIAAVWTEGDGPAVGNRFDGTNLAVLEVDGITIESEWTRPCTITACEPPTLFAYTVGDRFDGSPASEWEFRIVEGDGGCTVTQTFRHAPDGISGIRVMADEDPARVREIIADRSSALTDAMNSTLAAIKAAVETR